MSQSKTIRSCVSATCDTNYANEPVRQTLGSCSRANDKQRTLDLATGLPLINLRYNSKAHRKDGLATRTSWLEASSRVTGFSSLDALAALTSQYIAAYCQQQSQLYALCDADSQQQQQHHHFSLLNSTGLVDRSRSDGEEASAESCDDTLNNLSAYCWMSAKTGRQYIKCYLEVRKTHQDSDESSDSSDACSIPPLVTVRLPPNCRVVRQRGSLRFTASCCGSRDSQAALEARPRRRQRQGRTPSCPLPIFRSSSSPTLPGHSDEDVFDEDASSLADIDENDDDDDYDEVFGDGSPDRQAEVPRPPSRISIINVPPPPERQWAPTRSLDTNVPNGTFSVMSYNILCDKYATSNIYAYCPSWALTWDYRKKYVLSEITRHDSDIVALQEVETEQFHKFFKPELASRGYDGTFSPKSRAKTMSDDEKKYVDGCAIFWKVNKFELDSEHLIEFTRLAIAKAEGNEQMLNRVMTRDNIAMVAVFKIRDKIYANGVAPHELSGGAGLVGSPLVVCTAHIHWDPEFCDVKLIQAMMLIQELTGSVEKTAEKWRLPFSAVPLVVCGDLNSLPDSGVYDYLTSGKIPADHADFKDFKGQACIQRLSSSSSFSEAYSHRLRLKSAYDVNQLPFTNYTYDFKGVIDYIFGTSGLIKLGVLGPMDFSWFQDNKIVGCPFPGIPSDHIPLLVHYAILPPTMSRFLQFNS